jgi:undecaprenyl phosphate N,N'-diacetylbacillosamine 1-phosphate transferase
MTLYTKLFKRLFDLCFSIFLLVILSPVFLLLSLLLFIANNGSPFFLQARPGKNETIFKVIKFKTMNDKSNDKGYLLPDSERITSIGSFIRKTSLDEIPQLFNVIKGDMSLVGPRPLLIEYLSLYSNTQKKRHNVSPGITGWAQVNGRNAISWNEKFNYDVWYVDHISFALDLKIIWLTIIKIFKSENISSSTSVTMEKFTGNI